MEFTLSREFTLSLTMVGHGIFFGALPFVVLLLLWCGLAVVVVFVDGIFFGTRLRSNEVVDEQ